VKLLFENWRKYLNELTNTGIKSRTPVFGDPDSMNKPLKVNKDIPENPELNEEELEEESLEEVEPLPSPIDPVPFPGIKE